MNGLIKIGCILLVLYISAGSFVSGQQPYFREIINSNDIEGAQINCIYQDKSGFIWIGTNKGPYKFDGISYIKINTIDSTGRNSVTSIFDDVEGKIWFGYENGDIATYDYIQQQLLEPEGLRPRSKIMTIHQTADSSVIIGTYGEGIFVIKNNVFRHINTTKGLSDDYIYTMIIDRQDKIWAGTDNGINIIDLKNTGNPISTITVEDGLPDFIIQNLAIDSNGLIWIGTHDSGVCYYDPRQNSFIIPPNMEDWAYGPVRDILLMNDRIWIATDSRGIIDYTKTTKKIKNYQKCNNIDLARINHFLYDNEGNIWLSSNSEVYLSFGSRLEFINQINQIKTDNIHALTVDSKDRVWFANEAGIFRFDPNGQVAETTLEQYPVMFDIGEQKIMSLFEDPYGFIWIGTFGKGIIRLNPNTRQQVLITERNGLINGNVLSIKGTENEIWFATLGGASKIEINSNLSDINYIPVFENYQKKEGLSNNYIYHLYIDHQNRVWFATDGSGVSYFDNGIFKTISSGPDFANKVVYSVTGDQLGNIWMNIANEGLYKYNGDTVKKYLNDPDHKNLSFSGLHVNNNNELVIAYNDGIDILDIQSGDIIHYEENAGLSGFNPDLNTIGSDSKGTIWIGSSIGLVKYSSTSQPISKKPVSNINQVAVFLEQIDHKQQYSFPFNDNHFSFDYSGLWFQYPERVEFLIQLEGHDLDWIKTKNNSVIYSNLKPGKYTFKVKSALYNNFKNASIASYSFTINKPFWSSPWFYIFLATGIGIVLYFCIKYRENKVRLRQEAIREKIKFQFENLKSQINPHFLFNSFSTLIALIESDQEEAVEYVEELSALFRNMLEFKDQNLITMKEEMSIIDNYYKLQKKRYGSNLDLKISQEVRKESIKIPPMTLQMLIENAIKHNVVSKDTPLKINMYLNKNRSFLYIENNLQLRQENVNSTGIGIQNIINRYKLLTDIEIEITETSNIFKVGLPVIK